MRTYLDCIPCFVKQALEAARIITDDEAIHEQALRKALELAAGFSFKESPPIMGGRIHKMVRRLTGRADPYDEIKANSNRTAMAVIDDLRDLVRKAPDPFAAAVRLAMTGNIIDYGVVDHKVGSDMMGLVRDAMELELDGEGLEGLREKVGSAGRILYILDNAGEIVFDRILIETIGPERITAVVRGRPIINDVTMADARETGLTDLVDVIDSGMDIPGTVLDECTEQFKRAYESADLVIAKGQGNFESFSDPQKEIFYLLRVKCAVISHKIGKALGALIITSRNNID